MAGTKKITYVTLLGDESIHEEFERALVEVEKKLGQHHPMFIGNKGIFSNDEFEVRSPIDTNISIGSFQKGTREDALKAVQEARKSFDSWSRTDWKDRVKILRKTAETIDRQKFALSALITYEIGKNRYEALAEIGEAIDFLYYYANIYEKNEGYTLPTTSEVPDEHCKSVLKPHGVFAVISPFNFPVALAAGMASAALLTGNTVVMKPTSTAPFSGLKLYKAFVSSGIPPGAINMVTGPGNLFGEAIIDNPDVAGIAFTGSRSVGMWLFRNFADKQPYPKPVILELGSKNPAIVTASADIESAVEGVVRAAFGYGGQKCSATSRVYVDSKILDRFIEALKKRIDGIRTGDPRKKEVFMGPVISPHALETFRRACIETEEAGGTIITGGRILQKSPYATGYYATPTAVTGIPHTHPLMKEELFVPFLIVAPCRTLKDALNLANDTEYGLTAGIFSGKNEDIEYFFNNIRFGVTYSNRRGGATTGAWPGAQPFGGWRGSGSTGRGVGGPYYLLSFVREQAQTRVF